MRASTGFSRPALVVALLLSSVGCRTPEPARRPAPAYDVQILRDTYGVPHIIGATDADVAYGLAYAHAEDDFENIELSIIASRGRLAEVLGPDGAPNDYMVALFRVQQIVESRYPQELSPETYRLVEAYADGLNRFVDKHPDRVRHKAMLPYRGQDVIAGAVHKTPLFFGVHRALAAVFEGTYGEQLTRSSSEKVSVPDSELGSNAFALGPARTDDGHTRLVINSHQPWEGPVAWYEAHLKSDEGLDVVGGLFPGSPVILHGHNRHLGWAHTVNSPDLVDVYALKLDRTGERYLYEGRWLPLSIVQAPIRVHFGGITTITVHRPVGWSVHGPVMFTKQGAFALRFAGIGEIGHVEQWYRMNKATTLAEFHEVIRTRSVPALNILFADEQGHIGYVYNALAPRRLDGHDYRGVLPGDDSSAMWRAPHAFAALPQVWSPPSGFVQSTNATPFATTVGAANPSPVHAPAHLGVERWETNRMLRALELLGGDDSITADELLSVKFDVRYAEASWQADVIRKLVDAGPPDDPVLREAHAALSAWDLSCDVDNPHAAIGVMTLQPIEWALQERKEPPAPDVTFAKAARALHAAHGSVKVPYGDVNRLRRGDVDLPLSGCPDVLRAIDADTAAGVRTAKKGDSYILVVDWGPDGVTSQSVSPFGSSQDKTSPHYADQASLFAERAFKPVLMDLDDIEASLERRYWP